VASGAFNELRANYRQREFSAWLGDFYLYFFSDGCRVLLTLEGHLLKEFYDGR
jgi:hypothetical protein